MSDDQKPVFHVNDEKDQAVTADRIRTTIRLTVRQRAARKGWLTRKRLEAKRREAEA